MLDIDGRRMTATHTAPNGVINNETVFIFSQDDSLVWADYSGGGIRRGSLVGLIQGSSLEFRYSQAEVGGALNGGHSMCEVEALPDGRLRIIEHFSWESQDGEGTNVIEEIPRESD